jgi:hypothetical protein
MVKAVRPELECWMRTDMAERTGYRAVPLGPFHESRRADWTLELFIVTYAATRTKCTEFASSRRSRSVIRR